MKKLIGLVLVLIVAATAASAQITFRDVPADHWAAKAVYDLVRLGITQGYPDGTFRGTKNITRYETAMFLSKLASVAGAAGMEKLASELRAEIRALRAEIAALKRGVPGVAAAAPVSGSLKMSYLLGNLIASKDIAGTTMPRGPLTSYRLKTTLASNLGAGASVAVNLDTMDRGYFGGSENLVTSLLDASGTLKVDMGLDNPVDVKVTVGPGPQPINVVGGASKALAGAWFMRPYNGVGLATSIGGVELSGAYTALTQTAGDIGVNQLRNWSR